jgi:hypothetical protein
MSVVKVWVTPVESSMISSDGTAPKVPPPRVHNVLERTFANVPVARVPEPRSPMGFFDPATAGCYFPAV